MYGVKVSRPAGLLDFKLSREPLSLQSIPRRSGTPYSVISPQWIMLFKRKMSYRHYIAWCLHEYLTNNSGTRLSWLLGCIPRIEYPLNKHARMSSWITLVELYVSMLARGKDSDNNTMYNSSSKLNVALPTHHEEFQMRHSTMSRRSLRRIVPEPFHAALTQGFRM
jgi:hypothetical protein